MIPEKYKGTKVEKLREMLIDVGFDTDKVNSTIGKSNLVTLLEQVEDPNDGVDSIDLSLAEKVPDEFPENKGEEDTNGKPLYQGPGWDDYVMSFFDKKELFDGRPTVVALRRVVENVLGPIISSRPTDIKISPSNDLNYPDRVTCSYEIEIVWQITAYETFINIEQTLPTRVFGGVGDSSGLNTDPQYMIYPACMAETRAEGRALRKALGIKINSAEEVVQKDTSEIINRLTGVISDDLEWDEGAKISSSQLAIIKVKTQQLNIDVDKFVNYENKGDVKELENIDKGEAQNLIVKLNNYQTKHKNSETIPKEILKDEN